MKRKREKARDERVMRPRPPPSGKGLGCATAKGPAGYYVIIAVDLMWILCGDDPESMPLIGSFGLVIYLFDSLDRQVPWYLTYDGKIH